jgi:hypothetical protein
MLMIGNSSQTYVLIDRAASASHSASFPPISEMPKMIRIKYFQVFTIFTIYKETKYSTYANGD